MRKQPKRIRLCWICFGYIDMKRPKTYRFEERTYWHITKQYVYHEDCWRKREDHRAMRLYRQRLNTE